MKSKKCRRNQWTKAPSTMKAWVVCMLEGTFARHMPGAPSIQRNVPAIYHNALPPKITPSLSPGTLARAHCMTVGNQIRIIFSPDKWNNHLHPPLVGPIMATHLKIKESPLLCMTDHPSGHTEEWESLTPTRGPHQSVGKLCPVRPARARHATGLS